MRDAALTAPYMHDGSLKTLEEVVEHYDKGGNPNPSLDPDMKPLKLTAQESADVVAFMKALTGENKSLDELIPTLPAGADGSASRSSGGLDSSGQEGRWFPPSDNAGHEMILAESLTRQLNTWPVLRARRLPKPSGLVFCAETAEDATMIERWARPCPASLFHGRRAEILPARQPAVRSLPSWSEAMP